MKVSSIDQVKREVMKIMESRMRLVVADRDTTIKSDPSFPVDTQALKASQHTKVEADERSIRGMLINDSPYAFYQHEGTGLYAANGQGRKTPWLVHNVRYKGELRTFWTKGVKAHKFVSKHTITQEGRNAIHSILKGDRR